ncbi:hypothetical protein MMC21_003138 [Puttea exsequens]|nr:hypothetical protein [Puttea exsequens]
MSAAPASTSRWSDAEKVHLPSTPSLLHLTNPSLTPQVALLLSIMKSQGTTTISWAKVDVPTGRTLQSSQKIYEGIVKTGATVTMTSGESITPSKKRARGGAAGVKKVNEEGTPTKKRARKPKSEPNVLEEGWDGMDDEEESESKKMKVEEEDEGKNVIGGEIDDLMAQYTEEA